MRTWPGSGRAVFRLCTGAGEPGAEHPIGYQDEGFVGFSARHPTLPGYCLIAWKAPCNQRRHHALMTENGVLAVDDVGRAALAGPIRERAESS